MSQPDKSTENHFRDLDCFMLTTLASKMVVGHIPSGDEF